MPVPSPLSEKVNDIQLTANFKLREFECPCCKSVMLHKELLTILQLTREHLDRPVVINSGYRCDKHNCYVGGYEYSKHLRGEAVDISIPSSEYRREFIDTLMEYQDGVRYSVHDFDMYVHVELKDGEK